MLSDKELEHLSREVDDWLALTTIKYKLAPMSVCGIVLARLALMSKEVDSLNEFLLLLEAAKSQMMDAEEFNLKNNGNLH